MSYEGHFFFFENVQNLMYNSKMPKQIWKIIFVFEIMASELASLHSLYKAENICDRH